MDFAVLAVFLATYAGIALGRLPGLAIDRTGIALLGAVAMLLLGAISLPAATNAIHVPTLLLLYALMIFSAQLRLGGFYTWSAMRLFPWLAEPRRFLAATMITAALLSALLANDIVCLAFTPVLAAACLAARISPLPHLIGLAIASNLGSAATIIGNPQNMLIGQSGKLDFAAFTAWNLPPALLSLVAAYLILLYLYRRELARSAVQPTITVQEEWPVFDAWQSVKGLALLALLIVMFITDLPRELSAIALAALLLLSRKMHTRAMLSLIDWHLIVLFCALFVLIAAFTDSGWPQLAVSRLHDVGLALQGTPLAIFALLLSNLVSNVPACMLMIPFLDRNDVESWYLLAAASTYAGNLLLIGSIANLIVAEQASRQGIQLTFREHARAGIPITGASLLILLGWIWL